MQYPFAVLAAISQADLIVKYFTRQFLIAKANVSLSEALFNALRFHFVFGADNPAATISAFVENEQIEKRWDRNGSAMINSISLYLQSGRSPVLYKVGFSSKGVNR